MGTEHASLPGTAVSPFRAWLKVAWRRFREVWVQVRHSRTAMVGLAILVFFIAMAVFAPWIAPHGPLQRVDSNPPSAPSSAFPLGTDVAGNDIYSQIIWGSQISLIVGIASAIVASVVGTAVGLVSGFLGGWVDEVMMRFNDVVL
ncbi:MAG TPA: hypothetical protein VEY12_03995, partial [Thermoplasmata archaeon]|nr:hypothetical protein [Thermoplasmata archaeon]